MYVAYYRVGDVFSADLTTKSTVGFPMACNECIWLVPGTYEE